MHFAKMYFQAFFSLLKIRFTASGIHRTSILYTILVITSREKNFGRFSTHFPLKFYWKSLSKTKTLIQQKIMERDNFVPGCLISWSKAALLFSPAEQPKAISTLRLTPSCRGSLVGGCFHLPVPNTPCFWNEIAACGRDRTDSVSTCFRSGTGIGLLSTLGIFNHQV